jgi:hypothetical protein
MTKHCVATVVTAAYVSAFWACFVVLRVGISAKYAIPVMGMILGNTSTAVAVTLTSVTSTLKDQRDMIEVRLAMGASRWEAMSSTIRDAVVLGMTPVLNQMNIMGLVSIPGMMTGQILGGTPPALAARYQLIIMYLLCGAAIFSSTSAGVMVLLSCSDAQHRLHHARLTKRGKKGKNDPLLALVNFALGLAKQIAAAARGAGGTGSTDAGPAPAAKAEEKQGLLMTPQGAPAGEREASASGGSEDAWGDWRRVVDAASGDHYYYSVVTGQTSWSRPAGWK